MDSSFSHENFCRGKEQHRYNIEYYIVVFFQTFLCWFKHQTLFKVCPQQRGKTTRKLAITSIITQLTFTCSMSAIETLEKGMKYVQS